jgi:hypothetical protein
VELLVTRSLLPSATSRTVKVTSLTNVLPVYVTPVFWLLSATAAAS